MALLEAGRPEGVLVRFSIIFSGTCKSKIHPIGCAPLNPRPRILLSSDAWRSNIMEHRNDNVDSTEYVV